MSNSLFVTITMLFVIGSSMILGVVIKMWAYGIKDSRLFLSPIILIISILFPPLLVRRFIYDKSNESIPRGVTDFQRFLIWVRISIEMIRTYPAIVGLISSIISDKMIVIEIRFSAKSWGLLSEMVRNLFATERFSSLIEREV